MIPLCHAKLQRKPGHKVQPNLCQRPYGHPGPHSEFPYLAELHRTNKNVSEKIKRDAYKTTGASWKSENAGPNRTLRWLMLLSDTELPAYNIHMAKYKPQLVAKLRSKAATYEECVAVAKWLTWLVYQMPDAPSPSQELRNYLEAHYGAMQVNSTVCLVCREPLSFTLFKNAARGQAHVETCHADPRKHTAANVGFAHRECNIAQGSKTLEEFYNWIEQILDRVRAR